MRFTSPFFAKVAIAVMLSSGTLAAPWAPTAKYATHAVRELANGVKLEAYHPESNFQVRLSDILVDLFEIMFV
jgi:hypothetical protein